MVKNVATKTLSERVSARFSLKKTSASARNKSAFLALREEIKQALNDGWKSKNIWETLFDEGKITFSYSTFHNYVIKLILSNTTINTPQMQSNPSKTEEKQSSVRNKGIPSFTFNPVANKEDLI